MSTDLQIRALQADVIDRDRVIALLKSESYQSDQVRQLKKTIRQREQHISVLSKKLEHQRKKTASAEDMNRGAQKMAKEILLALVKRYVDSSIDQADWSSGGNE